MKPSEHILKHFHYSWIKSHPFPDGWQAFLDERKNEDISAEAEKLTKEPTEEKKTKFLELLTSSMQFNATLDGLTQPQPTAKDDAPTIAPPASLPPPKLTKPILSKADATTPSEDKGNSWKLWTRWQKGKPTDNKAEAKPTDESAKPEKPNLKIAVKPAAGDGAKPGAEGVKPAAAGAKPAAAEPAKPAPKAGLWQNLQTYAFYGFIAVIGLIILATILDTFVPGVAAKTNTNFNLLNSFSIKGDWSGFNHVKNNVAGSFNVGWVKTLTGIVFALTLIALFDTGVSNFTGGDMAAVGGFVTIIAAIPLMTENASLAIGLIALGLVVIRRDRDEGKGFGYYVLGAAAILMMIHFFGREWESWQSDSLGRSILKFFVGGYFKLTENFGPFIAIGMLILVYVSMYQDASKDGTMVTLLTSLIAYAITFGFVPILNQITGVLQPGGGTILNYVALIIWSLGIPMEAREAFARSWKNGKGVAGAVLLVAGFLAVSFWLGSVLSKAYGWSITASYTVTTLIITLILGMISMKMHQDGGDAGWKPWVASMENIMGDVITHHRMPWLFYPTFFSLGYLGLGVLIFLGKLP